jgi:dihydroxy-acid dehydratase
VREPARKTQFTGPAVVFESAPAAIEGIRQGAMKAGDVLVVRGMGPKGGPGMAGSASMVVFALDSAGLQQDVAFVTDGQLSGLCHQALTVAEVSPESAVGGPIALVENGDRISIDVDRQHLALEVPEADLARRQRARGAVPLPKSKGYLSIYQRSVQPMSTGAVLIEPVQRAPKM